MLVGGYKAQKGGAGGRALRRVERHAKKKQGNRTSSDTLKQRMEHEEGRVSDALQGSVVNGHLSGVAKEAKKGAHKQPATNRVGKGGGHPCVV